LQEREVRPLGANRSEKVDVRVVAATNRDLPARLSEGQFREDLFYRLNVIHIELKALRERPEDILPMAEHFLAASAKRSARPLVGSTPAAVKALLSYAWPGNVRELENVIERAVALAAGERIGVDDLPAQVRERKPAEVVAGAMARGLTLAELEREYILRVLQAEGGNKTRAALAYAEYINEGEPRDAADRTELDAERGKLDEETEVLGEQHGDRRVAGRQDDRELGPPIEKAPQRAVRLLEVDEHAAGV